VFFHLWGLEGPNWKREFVAWQKECNKEWTLVSPSKRRVQLGLLAMKTTPLKSAMKSANGAKRKLQFASDMVYVARKGYKSGTVVDNKHISSSKDSRAECSISASQVTMTPVCDPNGSSRLNQHSDSDKGDRVDDLHGLEEVVNDIADRFWRCARCLSMKHDKGSCTNQIRCRGCYRYGHVEKSCFNKIGKNNQLWVPKRVGSTISPGLDQTESPFISPAVSPPSSSTPCRDQIDSNPTPVMTHKYRGCIVVLSINKSVEPNEEQKVLMSGFDQGITVNTSKQVFRGIL
jgi:hypothetical protein